MVFSDSEADMDRPRAGLPLFTPSPSSSLFSPFGERAYSPVDDVFNTFSARKPQLMNRRVFSPQKRCVV